MLEKILGKGVRKVTDLEPTTENLGNLAHSARRGEKGDVDYAKIGRVKKGVLPQANLNASEAEELLKQNNEGRWP